MSEFKFIGRLIDALRQRFAEAALPADWTISPERCPEGMNGELTINCFRFAKLFKQPPDRLAAAIAECLDRDPEILATEQIKAFVNVVLTPAALYRDTLAALPELLAAGRLPENECRKILIEYSAPNTNKPQHLGHVRNNTLGMALASLLKRVGHEVIQINLVNDRGIHICKSMIAYQRFGNGATPESTGIKGDHLVGKFYVEYNQALSAELAALKAARPELAEKDNEALFLETELGQATQKMLQDWENGDPEVRALWQKMNGWVFDGFAATYRRMGIRFDHTYLESQTYLLGKDIIQDGLARGVFSRREDGAVIVDLGKMGNKVVLRSDGTSVYITQDIGTTLLKYNDYHPDMQIWVVGDEQILHFQMLFAILRKLGYEWADNLHHLAYGMVNLPSGKMKSREGTVVDADDLFAEMVALALDNCRERGDGEVTESELAGRAEIIGMGALKFMLLKFNPKTTMMFDPQASIKFEGDTGPYVQYACTRIKSIARKARERGLHFQPDEVDWSLLAAREEKAFAALAAFYPAALQLAAERRDCSVLVEYLLDLAKAFNRFYRECPVLTAENVELQQARLALAAAAGDILTDGLRTLTIGVPDAM
ncbi:arginine--tRNA ligase [Victivallis sp. Marseille-Q1083]|uniref:arginine--tRNA ligase n=1 Tax=Victivallis sp. Marseille-Q1083 TaxID=2717288 RepID=UPI00158BB1F8|nr:arginine--tRNA ligase [Victivallis sp. Marseille-Q1083]